MATFNFATSYKPNQSKPINWSAIQVTPPKTKIPNQSLVPNISTPQGKGQVQSNGTIILVNANNQPTGKVIYSGGGGASVAPATFAAPAAPRTITPTSVTPTSASRGTSSSSSLPSPIYSASQTYSPTTTTALRTITSTNAPISPSSLTPSAPIVLPSAPTYSNPGTINNQGLVNAMSESYQYDPATNSFVTKPQTDQKSETQGKLDLQNMLQELITKKENVYDNPDVRRQQADVQQKQQQVSDLTAQLNNVVAQQNADLLKLRGVGSQEGVTETVYGGQAATINREAAIKALPIQAALSAAQGNLKLAEDYLTQLTTWKKEEIDNDFAYKSAVRDSVRDFVKGEEKARLDALDKQEQRSYQEKRDNINSQDAWMKFAVQNGQSTLVSAIAALDPASTIFAQSLASITQQLKPKADTQVVEVGGRKVLIDTQTGATVRDLGASSSGTQSSKLSSTSVTQLKNALNESKFAGAEADGKYADPNLYLQNYESYLEHGGSAEEFFRNFPPATYINPSNTWLPPEIMQFTKKTESSAGFENPFK